MPNNFNRSNVLTYLVPYRQVTDLQYMATIGSPPTGPARPIFTRARSGMLAADVRIALSEEVLQVSLWENTR